MSGRLVLLIAFVVGCKSESSPATGSAITPAEAGAAMPPDATVAIVADAEVLYEAVAPAPDDVRDPDATSARAIIVEGSPGDEPRPRRPPGADLMEQIDDVKAASPVAVTRIAIVDKMIYGDSSLTLDDVATRVNQYAEGGVKACYARTLTKNPGARGNLIVGFAIDANGRTIDTSVKAFEQGLANCARSTVKAWRFPKPAKAKTARFTFKIALAIE